MNTSAPFYVWRIWRQISNAKLGRGNIVKYWPHINQSECWTGLPWLTKNSNMCLLKNESIPSVNHLIKLVLIDWHIKGTVVILTLPADFKLNKRSLWIYEIFGFSTFLLWNVYVQRVMVVYNAQFFAWVVSKIFSPMIEGHNRTSLLSQLYIHWP